MGPFQKVKQKLCVSDDKSQAFFGVLWLFALLLVLSLYFALQNQLAKHTEENPKQALELNTSWYSFKMQACLEASKSSKPTAFSGAAFPRDFSQRLSR